MCKSSGAVGMAWLSQMIRFVTAAPNPMGSVQPEKDSGSRGNGSVWLELNPPGVRRASWSPRAAAFMLSGGDDERQPVYRS
jgi:hypothetical protein